MVVEAMEEQFNPEKQMPHHAGIGRVPIGDVPVRPSRERVLTEKVFVQEGARGVHLLSSLWDGTTPRHTKMPVLFIVP
jgi:hypothetical protein